MHRKSEQRRVGDREETKATEWMGVEKREFLNQLETPDKE